MSNVVGPLLGLLVTLITISNCTSRAMFNITGAPMQKVLLTQRGYIQFLRWELPVPTFDEFTFCLWVKSNDLTYAHSIFSYSKDEKERLVRSWISANGESVHLEIGGAEVFRRPLVIGKNRWYHVCQSWENREGRYALWINGRVEIDGYSDETRNHAVPSGGDIVLGQEYTDFDKGLEEGIEGEVTGFNLLLASAFRPSHGNALPHGPPFGVVASDSAPWKHDDSAYGARIPRRVVRADSAKGRKTRGSFNETGTDGASRLDRRDVRSLGADPAPLETLEPDKDPLGLQLVKESYFHCEIGRGSPYVGGDLMLISWSRTPVRVFGGATLKNAAQRCGNF